MVIVALAPARRPRRRRRLVVGARLAPVFGRRVAAAWSAGPGRDRHRSSRRAPCLRARRRRRVVHGRRPARARPPVADGALSPRRLRPAGGGPRRAGAADRPADAHAAHPRGRRQPNGHGSDRRPGPRCSATPTASTPQSPRMDGRRQPLEFQFWASRRRRGRRRTRWPSGGCSPGGWPRTTGAELVRHALARVVGPVEADRLAGRYPAARRPCSATSPPAAGDRSSDAADGHGRPPTRRSDAAVVNAARAIRPRAARRARLARPDRAARQQQHLGGVGPADRHRPAAPGQRPAPAASSCPRRWYEMHLVAAGLDVQGVSVPGAPFVAIGHNARIAWGFTNTGADVQDFVVERIDTAGRRVQAGSGWAAGGGRGRADSGARPGRAGALPDLAHAARASSTPTRASSGRRRRHGCRRDAPRAGRAARAGAQVVGVRQRRVRRRLRGASIAPAPGRSSSARSTGSRRCRRTPSTPTSTATSAT